MAEEKTKNEEEYDICISCGKVTSHKKTDNVVYRSGYIEGAGQLCFVCNQKNDEDKEKEDEKRANRQF